MIRTAILAAAAVAALATPTLADGLVERGRYLATIMDCTGCHTDGALAGAPNPERHLAGSQVGFGIPGLGVVYPPNLTPDPQTGLASWTEEDLVRVLRTGVRPDGRGLVPVMPWPSYSALTDEDMRALVAYLRSLPPTHHKVPPMAGPSDVPGGPYLTVRMP